MWNVGSVMGDELLLDHLTTCNVPWQGAVAASFVDKEVHRWTSLKKLVARTNLRRIKQILNIFYLNYYFVILFIY